VVARSAIFIATRPIRIVSYDGSEAVALGIAYLSIAAFMHCNWFWSTHERYPIVGQLGTIASLATFVGGIEYLIYSVVMLK
jgi:hypothetical protein